jgi:hypothetical protein
LGEPKKFYKKSSMLTEISVDTEFSFDDYVSLENNRLAQEAMLINDDVMCSDEDREKDLKDLFNRHGYNLEFYN